MATREDINLLVSIANLAAQEANGALEQLFASLPQDPELARDILLEAVPALVAQYETLAAVSAEQWYRTLRQAQVAGSFQTVLGEAADPGLIAKLVRWAVTPLFNNGLGKEDALTRARTNMSQAVERKVKDGARSTVLANTLKDPQATRYARVPAGAETCAFCHMLASRGWIYATAQAASKSKKTGKSFHAGCDCQIVPAFGNTTPTIEGYDPDLLYQRYLFGEKELRARFPGKNPTDDDIAALVRRLLPGIYQEGYTPNPGDIPFAGRQPLTFTDSFRHHVLVGKSGKGGHFHSSPRPRKTKFPAWWTQEDIWQAAEDVFHFGVAQDRGGGLVQYRGYSRGVHMNLLVRDGVPQTLYPLDGDGVKILEGDGKLSPIPLTHKGRNANDVYSHRL